MGEEGTEKNQHEEDLLSLSSTRVFWKSRRRRAPASKSSVEKATKVADELTLETPEKLEELISNDIEKTNESTTASAVLSERRKALFEPLEPTENLSRKRQSAESLLPPPDFDTSTYPKGWLVGKKRKLVNVDVVESMRRIAVQELNRKDHEIDGLNEQLDEDARCLEHLQIQLLEEKRKKAEVERENALLQDQINMLMNMLQENDNMQEEDDDGAEDQKPF